MIKHVFFDFDGVLIDSEILYCEFVTKALKEELNFDLSIEDYAEKYSGQDLNQSLKQMNVFKNDAELEYFANRVTEKAKEVKKTSIKAIANAHEVIKSLSVPYAITSSGDSVSIKKALEITGLDSVFKGPIFGGMDIGKMKPDPAVYLKALQDTNTDPSQVLVIEDTLHGVHAAVGANIKHILGFTGGSHTYPKHEQVLKQAGAYKVSNTLLDALKISAQ